MQKVWCRKIISEEEKEELERLKKHWYLTDAVAFEMIDSMKYRESIFISTISRHVFRCLKINAVRFLYKNFDAYKFLEKPFNVYHSVAHFPELPMFPFKYEEKRKLMDKFNITFKDYMKGYDLFIDLDNENMELVYSSTARLKKILDEWKVRYSLVFSGTKGFHVGVSYQDFPDELKEIHHEDLANLFKQFAYELKLVEKIKDIDITVFDLRRIKKVPYSVVHPYYNVALPLSDEQFNNFRLSDVSLYSLASKAESMRRRGLLKREGDKDALLGLMYHIADKRKSCQKLFDIMKINRTTLYNELQKVMQK